MAALGALIVRIGAETSGLNKALTQAERDIQKAGKQFSKLGATLTQNLVLPIVAVGAALAASAIKVGTFADELLDLVDMTGLTAKTLQEFRHVAQVAGVGSDTLAQAAIKLTTAMSSGDEQGKKLGDALGLLGIKANDASGKLVSMDVLLPQIITGLQGMTDITSRNALAADIFGKAWSELAPILSMSAGEMSAARAEAQRLGLVMSDEALASANAFRKALGTLTETAGAITREIGVGMIPVMTSLAGFLQENVVPAVRAVVGWFGNLSTETKITIGVVAGLSVALTGLIVTLGVVLKMMPLLTAAFTVLTGPIGLTILAIGALTAAGIAMAQNWDWVKMQFVLAWTAMKDAAFASVGFILDLLTAMTARVPVLSAKIVGLRLAFDLLAEKSLAASGVAIGALETKMLGIGAAAAAATVEVKKLSAALVKPIISGGKDKKGTQFGTQFGGENWSDRGSGAKPTGWAALGLPDPKIAEMPNRAQPTAAGKRADDSTGTKISQVIQAGVGNSEMGQMVQAAASFGPMAILLPVINGAMEKLGPAFSKLIAPLVEIGGIVGEILAPVFEMLAPVVKMIANIMSAGLAPVLRIIVTVFSYVIEALGWFIKGLGVFIDKIIPDWVSKVGKGLAKQGQDMIDSARASRKNTDATDKATDAVNKFAGALSNVPRVLNINALRHMITGAGGGGTGGSGGGGGGGSGGGVGGGGGGGGRKGGLPQPMTINGDIYITVPGAGDPERVAQAVGRAIERTKARGGMSRLSLAVA